MAHPRMVIAGASGVVGRHLVAAARRRYEVTVLTRQVDGSEPRGARAVSWSPRAARENNHSALDALAATLEGVDALVNLAGSSIANGRMGAAHRRRLLESRLDATTTLLQAQQRTHTPPAAWFQGSAIHFYGDRGEELLTERSEGGRDHPLAEVSAAWERAAAPAGERSRLLLGRLGLVLATDAEAWQQLLRPVKLFVGGALGSGRQWYPWIDADDLARAVLFLLERTSADGVFNLTAPEPVRQLDLARAAAARLGRPALLPAPAPLLRLAVGGLADALLLPSTRAVPERLLELGFDFDRPDIESALDKLLPAAA